MSTGVVTFQTQVEAVLGALFKAATAELTELFESRYGALVVDAGRTEDLREKETLETTDTLSSGESRRSIGVQVEEDIYQPTELSGICCLCFKRDFLMESDTKSADKWLLNTLCIITGS